MKKFLNMFSVLLVLISTNVYSGQDVFDEVMEYRIGSEIDETRFDKEIQDDGSIKYILKEHKIPNSLTKKEDMVLEQRQVQIRMKYVFINEYEDIITRYF